MRSVFDLEKEKQKLKDLEKEIQTPDFWKNKEKAIEISQEINQLKEKVTSFDQLEEEIAGIDSQEKFNQLEQKLKEKEIQVFLSGEYDLGPALLSIYSGAGGQDAQDWVTILFKMYERYCQRKGFKIKVLHQSFGEGGGPEGRIGKKSVVSEIKGKFAFGFLKGENGVHRLVRISPFSTKKLRHTSFALVEVIPKIPEIAKEGIDIEPDDLKIDFYGASGPGGQYVNKRETAVRITHLPTKTIVACQSERSQAQNRKKAMELLYSRLNLFYKKKRQKEISKIKGDKVSVGWGSQIRNYVLHPYTLVKDLRTGIETASVEKVLDGQIDKFIEAEVKLKGD
ncbi:MAG: peptide chain release factor 2 [Patescibacteria group bacterium]|nr:peptide chain release factor 2 [Patescibacteria group bacterium]